MHASDVHHYEGATSSEPPPPTPVEHMANLTITLTEAINGAVKRLESVRRPSLVLQGASLGALLALVVIGIRAVFVLEQILDRLPPR